MLINNMMTFNIDLMNLFKTLMLMLLVDSNTILWVGRWCRVASSAGTSSTLAYVRAGACCACSRCGKGGLCFFFCFCFFVVVFF